MEEHPKQRLGLGAPALTFNNKEMRFRISTFNGKLQLSVLPPFKTGNKPVWSKNLNLMDTMQFMKQLKALGGTAPGASTTLVIKEYTHGDGSADIGSMTIGKDDKGCCYIKFIIPVNGAPQTVVFQTVIYGDLRPSTELDQDYVALTASGVEVTLWWMETIMPTALCVGDIYVPKPRNFGNANAGAQF